MKFILFKDVPVWYKIVITLFVVFSGLVLASIFSPVIAAPFFHLSINDIEKLLTGGIDQKNVPLLKFLQIFEAIGAFVIPSLMLAYIFSGRTGNYLKMEKPAITSISIVIICMVTAIPIINFTSWFNSMLTLPESMNGLQNKITQLENEASQLMESFLVTTTFGGYVVNLFMIAIIPALGEEFLFRGIFQRLFSELTGNVHFGILIAAFLFSFFHFQFFGFVPRFLLGVYFGYLLIWTGTIWIPVIAHFMNNALAVTFYTYWHGTKSEKTIDTIGTLPGDRIYLLLSVMLLSVLTVGLYYFEKERTRKKTTY